MRSTASRWLPFQSRLSNRSGARRVIARNSALYSVKACAIAFAQSCARAGCGLWAVGCGPEAKSLLPVARPGRQASGQIADQGVSELAGLDLLRALHEPRE